MVSLTRRAALGAFGAGAALACAPRAVAIDPPASAGPKRGGRLRVGIRGGDAPSIDGHRINQTLLDSVWSAYDTLIAYDDHLVPQPMLAERWDLSADTRELRLHLRRGVQFHSGRELTSDDVRYNLLRVRDPRVGVAQLATQSAWFTDIETPDRHTVVLRTNRVRPTLFDFFEMLNIVDRDTMEGPSAATAAVGTGPFRLVEYVPNVRMRFARNASYWRPDRPLLDELEVSIPTDPQAGVALLESGALDLLVNPPTRDLVRLRGSASYTTLRNQLSGTHSLLAANTRVAPLADKRVRRALSHALDRRRYAASVLLETEDWRVLPWAPSSPAYDAARAQSVPFDLDRARSLLREAGAGDLRLELVYGTSDTETANLGEIFQSDLAKIGVKLQLRRVESATFADLTSAAKLQYQGLAGGGVVSRSGGLEGTTLLTTSSWYFPANNRAGFSSDRYRALVESTSAEPDAQRRRLAYREINDLLLDESWALTVATASTQIAARRAVRGIGWRIHEGLRHSEIWIE